VYLKRSLNLAAVCLAAFAILIASAAAARGPQQAHRQFHFRTPGAVLKYLKTHGIDTRGMVIQRGHRNYAGPNCPGKRWSCTKAKHVIQFSTASASNQFFCSPSYGSPTVLGTPAPTSSPPNECIIVQVSPDGSDNNAKCVETTTATSPTLDCQVWQENTTGANNALIVQLITQRAGQSQDGHENAQVHQQNGSGANNAAITQTIWQNVFASGPAVGQSQTANVNNTIEQNGGTSTQLGTMSQLVIQVASAGKKRDEDDGSKTSTPPLAPTSPTPFSGSQSQSGDGNGSVDQHSAGVSKAFTFQNMFQKETAPSGVDQNQVGPFHCCTFQDSNLDDQFSIQQSKTQLTSSSTSDQFLQQDGQLVTTGHGHISQFANEDGTTQSNTCDVNGGTCMASQQCSTGAESLGGCAPPSSCNSNANPDCTVCSECCTICLASTSSGATAQATMRATPISRARRLRHHF
jgi:hypothetical protein